MTPRFWSEPLEAWGQGKLEKEQVWGEGSQAYGQFELEIPPGCLGVYILHCGVTRVILILWQCFLLSVNHDFKLYVSSDCRG